MVANDKVRFEVPIGFNGEGYRRAVEEYVAGLVGRKFTQELHDEIVETASAMAKDFIQIKEVTVSFE